MAGLFPPANFPDFPRLRTPSPGELQGRGPLLVHFYSLRGPGISMGGMAPQSNGVKPYSLISMDSNPGCSFSPFLWSRLLPGEANLFSGREVPSSKGVKT